MVEQNKPIFKRRMIGLHDRSIILHIKLLFLVKNDKNVKKFGFLGNFDEKFSILGQKAMQFSLYDQRLPSIMKTNHSSFENGLGFVLIMSTYEYLEQKVKIGVKSTSFSIQIPFFLKCSCTFVPWELDHDTW